MKYTELKIKNIDMNRFKIIYKFLFIFVLIMLTLTLWNKRAEAQNSLDVQASGGEYVNKVKITWSYSQMSVTPSSIEIKRDGEQIGIIENSIIFDTVQKLL